MFKSDIDCRLSEKCVLECYRQFLSRQVTILFSPTLSMLSDESKHVSLALIRDAANYGTLPQHTGGTAIYGLHRYVPL